MKDEHERAILPPSKQYTGRKASTANTTDRLILDLDGRKAKAPIECFIRSTLKALLRGFGLVCVQVRHQDADELARERDKASGERPC